MGSTLSDFKEFCQSFDPINKGLTLSNASHIRAVHNSFARQTLFELDNKKSGKDEDAYHFVSYLPIDGRLYELDGMKDGPIDLGAVGPDQEWLNVVRPIIEKRMEKYNEGEIHFNLLAAVSDRQLVYQQQIDSLLNAGDDIMDTDSVQLEVARLRGLIEDDLLKKKQYKVTRSTHFLLNPIILILIQLYLFKIHVDRKYSSKAQLFTVDCRNIKAISRTRSIGAHL